MAAAAAAAEAAVATGLQACYAPAGLQRHATVHVLTATGEYHQATAFWLHDGDVVDGGQIPSAHGRVL